MKDESTSPSTSEGVKLQKQLQELCRSINIGQSDARSSLLGRILTITDAAISDPKQRQAVKDLVDRAIYSTSAPYEQDIVRHEIEYFAKAHGIDQLFEPEAYDLKPSTNKYADIK
jgi:hypothetical protein